MLKSSILAVLLVALLALPAVAGDPLDGNDVQKSLGTVDHDCWQAQTHPQCEPCWDNCYYAIIADLWTGGSGWDGDEW